MIKVLMLAGAETEVITDKYAKSGYVDYEGSECDADGWRLFDGKKLHYRGYYRVGSKMFYTSWDYPNPRAAAYAAKRMADERDVNLGENEQVFWQCQEIKYHYGMQFHPTEKLPIHHHEGVSAEPVKVAPEPFTASRCYDHDMCSSFGRNC